MNGVNAGIKEGARNLLVVIVNYKTFGLTLACLRSLVPELKDLPGSHVTVVDNNSGDGPALEDAIRSHGWEDWVTLIVAAQNGGFAAGNNVAIRPALASAAPPRFIMLLNSDTEVRPGAIRILLEFMEAHPDVGLAGSGIENLDGSDWPMAFRFITPASQLVSGLRLGVVDRLFSQHVVVRRMSQDRPAPVDWVSGASIIIRREVFDSIGVMDGGYFLYFEELDFCLRAHRAGWTCWYVPQSRVMHIGGASTGISEANGVEGSAVIPRLPECWFDSRRRYFLKNFGLLSAIAADLGFSAGYAIWRLRRRLQRKPDRDPPHLLVDFLRYSVLIRGSSLAVSPSEI